MSEPDISSFDGVAMVSRPIDATIPHRIVEVRADGWQVVPTRPSDGSVVVWGWGPPLRIGPLAHAIVASVSRESVLLRTRFAGASEGATSAHRLDPPQWQGRPVRDRLRRALLAGIVVRQAPDDVATVLDDVVRRVDVRAIGRLRPGYDGSLLLAAETSTGRVLLRFAAEDGGTDPRRAGEALSRLGAAGVRSVPQLMAHGAVRGVAWTAETLLPGRIIRRVAPPTIADITAFTRSLPGASRSVEGVLSDLRTLRGWFPAWTDTLEMLLDELERDLAGLPGVFRHGDLWTGNLLSVRGRLSGVVDWDGWHESGVPGSDLLHLITADHLSNGASPSDVWLRQPWRSARFRRMVAASRDDLVEGDLTAPVLDAIAIAWWSGMVVAKLRRHPEYYFFHPTWVRDHVHAVLARISR